MSDKKIMKTLNGYTVYDEDAHRRIDSLEGAAPGLVFDTVADMEAYVAEHSAELKVGQNLYIRGVDVPDYWWDGTAVQELEVKVDLSGYAKQEEVERLSEAIADKADKTLKSADGDSWEVAVESGGDVVTHKTSGAVEVVAESLESATLSDKVLTLTGITGTYGAVIIPDASEISIDVPVNVEVNPYFADPDGWQNPSFGWFFLRTADGYIAVHTTNYAEVYTVSADLGTWTSVSGATSNIAQKTMRVVLNSGTATVYSDDVVTYSVDGISGIGYCASSVKVLTIYGVTVIHRQSTGSGDVDLSEVNERIDTLNNSKMDKILYSPDGTAWTISVSNTGVITATKYGTGGEDDIPTVLETYTIFVPENVSDEWKVTSVGGLNMSSAEFLELFYDGFVSAPPGGVTVTKTSIGKDESEQYDMWEYDFCPVNYSRTILLSSGMHAYELSASFGLANFIGHLYTDTDNDAFAYIRNNVRVKVIPIVNPWGFNQYPKVYGNINDVNPNRNFDLNGEWEAYEGNTTEWNQKGVAPFSESEVVNLARWAETNWNAEFWIDCHTGEGYSDKDLWVYYSNDSVILDRINGAISAIEAWFKETYGSDCVTTRTIDNPDSIRLHWAEKIAGIPGMTLEQAPKRETFGTSAMNEAADISNYSTNISTFVQEFLMEKYRSNNMVAITGISASNISISGDTLSVTAEAVMTPSNTTQNKFKWESSNESVVAVYGCTNKAIIVRKGVGMATITLTNCENSSVATSFTVTVEAEETFMEIGAGIRKVDSATGYIAESTNRIYTDLIPVEAGNLAFTCANGFYIKAWQYDADGIATGDYIGGLTTNSISGTVTAGYIRVLYKRSDNSDITETAMLGVTGTINGAKYKLVATGEIISNVHNIGAAIKQIDADNQTVLESTNRILTDNIIIALRGASSYTITVPSGYAFKALDCDSNGNIDWNEVAGAFEQTFTTRNYPEENKYARLYIKKTDDSEITDAEMLAIQLVTSTGYTYQLVQTDEQ